MTLNINEHQPRNYGWLEVDLDDDVIQHIWSCAKGKKQPYKDKLVGHIESSYLLQDKNDYLWKNVIKPCVNYYGKRYGHIHANIPILSPLTPYLQDLWINYQNQHEFNPIHDHGGVYSFAAWLKIPYDFQEQGENYNSKEVSYKFNGTFCFEYANILGQQTTYAYQLDKSYEGKLIFFPAKLKHVVYPYYNCDEQRVSIAGNVNLKCK